MPSTAISAQGSKLEVSGTTGSAKTITAVAVGSPTILTSAAHGLTNGDVVTLAALTGADAGLLNGKTVVVKNVTTNTFAVDIDTTGKTVTAGSGTATPVTWTQIKNLVSFSGFDGQASELDVTDLDSTAKEFMLGLQDWGTFSFDVNRDFDDAGQQAVDAAKRAGAQKAYKLTLPNGKTKTFDAYCKNSPLEGGVDQVLKTSGVTLRITGDVVDA
ncbi:phage tail tube protein [Cupriavidus oxalaticus]|uniref:Phage tail protein n=1 Tax=Cupriavidus oxalaticus TaxID=96344 RepID=A0A5P3VL80_9BURK|nr:phage tail tube protein [Cupriavidus oxalaticus]QEZ47184.1 phage tail protein [Cupriavidus oxalaticus]